MFLRVLWQEDDARAPGLGAAKRFEPPAALAAAIADESGPLLPTSAAWR